MVVVDEEIPYEGRSNQSRESQHVRDVVNVLSGLKRDTRQYARLCGVRLRARSQELAQPFCSRFWCSGEHHTVVFDRLVDYSLTISSAGQTVATVSSVYNTCFHGF